MFQIREKIAKEQKATGQKYQNTVQQKGEQRKMEGTENECEFDKIVVENKYFRKVSTKKALVTINRY